MSSTIVIGLTGGIACGKSLVSGALAAAGCRIIDGDLLSRELAAPGGPVLPDIRAAFGAEVFLPDGQLDRRRLGQLVFSDPEALARLNALYRPHLIRLIEQRLREAKDAGAPAAVLDMPLLFEAGLDRLCDTVWCVTLPEEEQLRRLTVRDGLTREAARQRVASQMPAAERAARSDRLLDNSGPPEKTVAAARRLLEETLRTPPPGPSGL